MGPFIKVVISQRWRGRFSKEDFTYKAYLVKMMTKGEGVENLKRLKTSFMNGPFVYAFMRIHVAYARGHEINAHYHTQILPHCPKIFKKR